MPISVKQWIRKAGANLVLRGAALVGKFLLLVVVARYLTSEDLGVYGLMGATVGLGVYVLGLEFHLFNTREIVESKSNVRGRKVRDQFVLHGLTHLIMLPGMSLIFVTGLLSWTYAPFFYAILVIEHVAQEFYRVLIALSRPVEATIVFFFRGGGWVYLFAGLLYIEAIPNSINSLWYSWIGGAAVSVILGIVFLRDLVLPSPSDVPIDWSWIRHGLRISALFFVGAIMMRSIMAVDRYALKHFHDAGEVGIYTFYVSIANTIRGFVDTAITIVVLPKILTAFGEGEYEEYRSLMKQMATAVAGVGGALIVAAAIGIYPVLALVGNAEYESGISTYWILLAAMAIAIAGLIPHYALYVRNADRAIVLSAVIGFVVAVVANAWLVPSYASVGASWAMLLSMTAILLAKIGFLYRLRPETTSA